MTDYVLFKSNGKWCGTSKANYDAYAQDARAIHKYEHDDIVELVGYVYQYILTNGEKLTIINKD